MKARTGAVLGAVLLLGLMWAPGATAAPGWICSITEAVACEEDGSVGPPDLGGLVPPTFLHVDAGEKEITLLAPPARAGEVTKVDAVLQSEGIWVLSGVEAGRAWSMVISDEGHMTLSVTVDGATWSVFGNAMSEE